MKRLCVFFWGALLFATTAYAQTVTVSVPDIQQSEGKTFRLPVKVSDLSGLNIYSFDLTLVYDPGVLTALDARTSGSLSASWGPATKNITSGQIQVGIGGTNALSGAGDLIYLIFKVNNGVSVGKTSILTFTNFKFNEGSPSVQLNNGTFTVILDTEPPKITSGPQAVNLTAHSADIHWRTDEPADSKVEYGLTSSYGDVLENSSLVTSHSVTLHPLKPSTTYHYRVASKDKLGNGPTVSSDQTFTTAAIIARLPSLSLDPGADIIFPLTVTDVSEQGITSAEIVVTYDAGLLSPTGVSSDGTLISAWNSPAFQVESGKITITLSGTTPLSGSGILVNIQFHISDAAKIGQTTPLTFQKFMLKNSGGETIPATTQNGRFTVEDTRPPEIVSGPQVESITAKSAVVTWQTNEKSTSIVRYGRDTSYGWQKKNQTRTLQHSVLLSNLSPSTTYHFQVGSVDSSGNGPTFSQDATFSTEAGTGIILTAENVTGQAGNDVTVPLRVTDVSQQGVRRYTVVLTYDSELITAVSAQTSGTLTSGWGAPVFQKVDGQVVIQGQSGTPLAGAGVLVKVIFHVKSDVTDGVTTPISFVFAQFNTGMPELTTANGLLTLRGTPDSQAPQITFGPFAQNISATGAQIVWVTDEPSSGIVEFGTGTSYGQTAGGAAVFERIHRITLSGLLPGTRYHFRVKSSDRWGNGPTVSPDASFQTTNGGEVQVSLPNRTIRAGTQFDWPIQIGDVSGKSVYSADITVTFDPDVLTAISASTSGTRASSWGPPTTTVKRGKIIIAMGGISALSGSGSLVKIRFQVSGSAKEGTQAPVVFQRFVFNEGTPASVYRGGLFTVKDVTAPKITAGPSVVAKTASTATILWATNEASTGRIDYGETASYGQMEESGILEKSHLAVITGLYSGTTYHFRVSSTDASGNGPTQSADQTFQTVVEQPMIFRLPSVAYDVGHTFDLPVRLDSLGNGSLYSFKMTLKFDSRYLEATGVKTAGSLTEFWEAPVVSVGPDSVSIEMRSNNPIHENGVLFKVQFRVKTGGAYNYPTPLTLQNVSANGLSSGFVIREGRFTLRDLTPPEILTGPNSTEVRAHSVHIVWTTNEPSNSKVDYGVTSTYDKAVESEDLVTYHDLAVAGLNPNTTYHFRVSSTDSVGNGPVQSTDQTFTTTSGNEVVVSIPDTLAPVGQTIWYPVSVEDVTGKNITRYHFILKYDSSAVRALQVRKTGTLSASWGTPTVGITDTSITVDHTGNAPLSGSGDLIQIQFKIKATAGVGRDVGLIFQEFTFNTGDPPASPNSARWLLVDRTPPEFVGTPKVTDVGFNYATLFWKTNELTTGKIDYGTTPSYGKQLKETKIDTVHRITIENLTALTTYHFRVSVTDTAGNGPVLSKDLSFTTLSDTVFVTVPDTTVPMGSTFELPLVVTNLTGFGITRFAIEIAYNPDQITALGASSRGTLAQDWGVPAFSASDHVLHVEMSGTEPLKGTGVLIRLKFQLLGGVVPGTDLEIPFQSFQFNNGTPVVKTTPAKIHAIAGGSGIEVSLPDTSFLPGKSVRIPVRVGDLTQKGIFSFNGKLVFSHSVLKISGATTQKSLLEAWKTIDASVYPDSVIFSAQGTKALSDSGVLFYFEGTTNSQANEGDTSSLILERFTFNRGNPVAQVKNGRVRIVIRHDAISGLVFESDSVTVLPGATISARETGTQTVKTARSDTTGFFQIRGLDSTRTYDVFASKAGYTPSDILRKIKPGARNLKLYLEKQNGFIDGWVKANTGEPVVGALVVADDGHTHFGSGNTDSTGHFAINNLAKRYAYTVKITKYGFHDKIISNVAVNQTVSVTLDWFYGRVLGMVRDTTRAPMDSVWVQALNLKKGTRVDSFLTGKDGRYQLDSLKADQYLVYALRNGFVSTPNQVTVNLAPGDTVTEDFILEKAVLASIEISGDREIPNNVPSRFDFVAKTAGGKVMGLQSPVWKLWPEAAGVVSQGVVYPDSQYFGEAFLSVMDPFTGIADTLAISLYAPVSPSSQLTVKNADGVTLAIAAGSVDQPQKIKIQAISLPSVKKSTKRYAALGKGYLLKPGGFHFLKPLQLTLPVPEGFVPKRTRIGKWNQELARWDILETRVTGERAITADVESFSLLAVLNPARDLGMESLKLIPNPFSPVVDSDGDGSPGLTIQFLITSRDTRRPFVTIEIYSMVGQKVRTLLDDQPENKDQYLRFHWDGLTDDGRMARNGRYLIKIDVSDATGTKTTLKTVVLVK
ncbi:MAG: hypothetical protein GXO76_12430 [Calditrichaeota bacterium]|nr:hypothetical protein [Calditrichota bacterium]